MAGEYGSWCGICQGSEYKELIIWKINKQKYMTNKPVRMGTKWFWDEHVEVTKVACIIAPMEVYSAYRYFQKEKYSYDRYPNQVYLNTPSLIIYLNAIKTLICHTEIEFNVVCFFRFCTKYYCLTWFSKYRIELIMALFSTNTTENK